MEAYHSKKSRDNTYYMQLAINLAKKGMATDGSSGFGAVIVRQDQIIATAYNTVGASNDCTQHAELSVIQKGGKIIGYKNLKECDLYTSCEPCMMCLGACYWAGFKTIYFGASAEDAKSFGFIYSNMFYSSSNKDRFQEFNMKQLMRAEAIEVWRLNKAN